jgi:hypothetical protein
LSILIVKSVFGVYRLFNINTKQTKIVFNNFYGLRDDELNKSYVKSHPNNFWLVNSNVVQYSSYVIFEPNKTRPHRIESLILLNYYNEHRLRIYKHIKCAYLDETRNRVNIVDVDRVVDIVSKDDSGKKTLWKIECLLNEETIQNDGPRLLVAIIDITDFRHDLSVVNGELPFDYMQFQVSDTIAGLAPKQQRIGHCVHMVYLNDTNSLDTNITINWLKMQKYIGIDTIRLYAFKIRDDVIDHVKSKFDDKFVEFIKYPTTFDDICKWQDENRRKNTVFRYMFDICKKTIERHFSLKGVAYGQHERINTNDCYLNFRYTHEYVTNYDIDESKYKSNTQKF